MSDIKQEVEKISSANSESFNRQDAAGIAALYADDGMHINPAGPRTDIEQFYQGVFKAGFDHQEVSVDEAWPLALQLQFFLEMGSARVGLMSPAPGRPSE